MSDQPQTTITRDSKCPGATITFGEWCDELDQEAAKFDFPYGPGSTVANTGADAWWLYYEMGYAPHHALAEDASYAE